MDEPLREDHQTLGPSHPVGRPAWPPPPHPWGGELRPSLTEPAPPEPPRPRRRWLVALIAAVVALAVSGGALAVSLRSNDAPVAAKVPPASFTQSDQAAPHSSLSEMIQRVLPSVVNVRVTSVDVGPLGAQEGRAEGSGVIIDREGIILTNNHVIAGAVNVSVLFNDGRDAMDGTVVGSDPQHDLAVIRVDATDLTPITIGRSSALRLGDDVVAIGFPLDLGGPTVTKGIVSGLNRTVQVQGPAGVERLVGLLQTDAAINPGNSGGALVDGAGQLVGINTAGAQAGAAENVGFAIAIDEALPIVRQILSQPPEERAWLGVSAITVDSPATATQLGVPADVRGAGIVAVVPGSPAEEAGIQEGDVIVRIDGRDIASSEDLSRVLTDLKPEDTVRVDLIDQSGGRSVEVQLAQRPAGL